MSHEKGEVSYPKKLPYLMCSEKEFKPYQMQNVETATTEKQFLNLEDSKLLKAKPVEVRETVMSHRRGPRIHPSRSLTDLLY